MAWNSYQMPGAAPVAGFGAGGTGNFFRPNTSQMMSGSALQSYLTGGGTPQAETNRTVKFDGGLTREMMGQGFAQLDDNNRAGFGALGQDLQAGFKGVGSGLTGLSDQFGTRFDKLGTDLEQYAKYGGLFGDKNSPVYGGQGKNGYAAGFQTANPFNIGAF